VHKQISEKPEFAKNSRELRVKSRRDKGQGAITDNLFVTHALLLVGCVVLYVISRIELIHFHKAHIDLARRILLGAAFIVIVLAMRNRSRSMPWAKSKTRPTFHSQTYSNIWIVALLIGLSPSRIFRKLVCRAHRGCVISVIVDWLWQTPMKVSSAGSTSSSANLIVSGTAFESMMPPRRHRREYISTPRVGIRRQYISGDHPSGRVIKFPNEKCSTKLVYNYSWPLFPYLERNQISDRLSGVI